MPGMRMTEPTGSLGLIEQKFSYLQGGLAVTDRCIDVILIKCAKSISAKLVGEQTYRQKISCS